MQAVTLSGGQAAVLSTKERKSLELAVGNAYSSNTRKALSQGWKSWLQWTDDRGYSAIPAAPEHVAAYAAYLAEHGRAEATIKSAVWAVSTAHKWRGLPNPAASSLVKTALKGLSRRAKARPKQATGLRLEHLGAITEVADDLTLAIVRLMFDAQLRRSEAAAVMWEHITEEADGSGRLFIPRSKTDQSGKGAIQWLSQDTMAALQKLPVVGKSVFGLSDSAIYRRIRAVAAKAGLKGSFSGHSPRVGMAQDQCENGASLVEMQISGRWKSPAMPAKYSENQAAARGAVARLYQQRSKS